jgi:hypothetical protein
MNYPQTRRADLAPPKPNQLSQIVYPLAQIGILALVIWMAYVAINGLHHFLSNISWDWIGIGLALMIPIGYSIAVSRREIYGDNGDGKPTSF